MKLLLAWCGFLLIAAATAVSAQPAAEAETDKNVPKAAHYMKLSGIKMISTTCP